jgi:hypothetical protein
MLRWKREQKQAIKHIVGLDTVTEKLRQVS